MRSVGTGVVVARLRVRGGRRMGITVVAGVTRRDPAVTRWNHGLTGRDAAVTGRNAAVTGRRSRRARRVVTRGGHALQTPYETEGHRNDQNFPTPPDLWAPSDRGILR